jgi:hypothetical protein
MEIEKFVRNGKFIKFLAEEKGKIPQENQPRRLEQNDDTSERGRDQ